MTLKIIFKKLLHPENPRTTISVNPEPKYNRLWFHGTIAGREKGRSGVVFPAIGDTKHIIQETKDADIR
jgi:hypothetical protein